MMVILCIVTMHGAGTWLLFKVRQCQIRNEVRERIREEVPEEALVKFSEGKSSGDIVWVEEDEFQHEGVLYDVLSRDTTVSGEVILLCIRDGEESDLYAWMEKVVKDRMGKSAEDAGQEELSDSLSKIMPLQLPRILFSQGNALNISIGSQPVYHSPGQGIECPPPERV